MSEIAFAFVLFLLNHQEKLARAQDVVQRVYKKHQQVLKSYVHRLIIRKGSGFFSHVDNSFVIRNIRLNSLVFLLSLILAVSFR